MSLLCIQIPDCSEVMHGGIPSDLSRADGFAEVHLAEVFEESVVYILHLVWPGIGTGFPDGNDILSWNADVSVPQSSLNHTVHRMYSS